MNNFKLNNRFFALVFLLIGLNANAETMPYNVYEAQSLSLKLANDGTGIIKNVYCPDCGFSTVKITKDSKATANSVAVNIFDARSRAGKSAMVSFNPETREVQYIRWQEEQ